VLATIQPFADGGATAHAPNPDSPLAQPLRATNASTEVAPVVAAAGAALVGAAANHLPNVVSAIARSHHRHFLSKT